MFQITQMVVKTDESGLDIDEIGPCWVMENENNKIVQYKTLRGAVRFVERQEGVKLEEIGDGWYREEGKKLNPGGTDTFWHIDWNFEEVAQDAS